MLFEKTFDLGLILNGLQIVSPPYGAIPRQPQRQGGYHMNMIHKLFEQLKEGYREYVRITTCDYRF